MEFRILGPLEVLGAGGQPLEISGTRARRLVVALALNPGDALTSDRLIDLVWGDDLPAHAANALQVQVSKLRRSLGEGVLVTRGRAYILDVPPEAVDGHRFEAQVASAHAARDAGEHGPAFALLRDALALWRGPALVDLDHPDARAQAARLEELRLSASERRADCGLDLGRHEEVVAELEALVAQHPLREGLHARLMLALYRSGRQAEALRVFQAVRRTLGDELGHLRHR
jgi:DNA-binding SARP family transcriptional activator